MKSLIICQIEPNKDSLDYKMAIIEGGRARWGKGRDDTLRLSFALPFRLEFVC